MRKIVPITEQFQHFVEDLKESFWGDLYGRTRAAWKDSLQRESERERDRYLGLGWYDRAESRRDWRNGFYERDFVTGLERFVCALRARAARSFCPRDLENFQGEPMTGWQPAVAALCTQPGREPGCLGGIAAGSVSAWSDRRQAATDCHRWLPRASRCLSRCLSPCAASALLAA